MIDESLEFGCKVTCGILHHNWYLVVDEVGEKIPMKGDGHVEGRLYLITKREDCIQKGQQGR